MLYSCPKIELNTWNTCNSESYLLLLAQDILILMRQNILLIILITNHLSIGLIGPSLYCWRCWKIIWKDIWVNAFVEESTLPFFIPIFLAMKLKVSILSLTSLSFLNSLSTTSSSMVPTMTMWAPYKPSSSMPAKLID